MTSMQSGHNSEEVFVFPASFAQQRLWFLDQLFPGTSYNVLTALRLTGVLNLAALEESFNEIVRRHEVLRTTFSTIAGQPVQLIAPDLKVSLPLINLEQIPISKEAAAKQLIVQEMQQPFNLTQSPLLRVTLLQLSITDYVLVINLHHIVFDEWSSALLIRELGLLYTAFNAGKPSPLPLLPIQYADFANWQHQWLQGEVLESQLSYWRSQLANLSVLEIPTNRPRLNEPRYRGATQLLELPLHLSQALMALSQQEGVTLFMTLLAAFQALLYRYTGQTDIAVGSPIANRNRRELEDLIGFFANSLVLRTDLSGNPTFRELLSRVRQVAVAAYAHQDLPFEKLVEELHPERKGNRNPLFQVVFALQNAPMEQLELPGLTLASFNTETTTARFDLELYLWECAENFRNFWGEGWQQSAGLRGVLVYNTDLFEPSAIALMLDHFQILLAGAVANPDTCLADLPLLSAAEQHQILVEWNQTARNYPDKSCIHQLFEDQVAQNPTAIAVSYQERQFTYQELNSGSNQLAHYLQKLGVGGETLVGICMEPSPMMVAAMLAILKAGGAYVALDPNPPERLRFMLEDTQISVLLTQGNLELATREADVNLSQNFKVVCLETDWQAIALCSEENLINQTTVDDLAYVIYTSGSTGIPKGVAVPHQAVNRLVCNPNYITWKPEDKVAQCANIAFDAATFEIWGALLNGAQLVGINSEVILSPQDFAEEIRSSEISVLFLTTALFNQMAREAPDSFNSLRYLLFGGEAVDPKSVKAVLEHGAPEHLLHVYGPTENTTFTSWYEVQAPEKSLQCLREETSRKAATSASIPIGKAIANTQIYLLDAHLNPLPIGVTGEIYIGGDGLARGYLNSPELTQERFIPNPFCDSGNQRTRGQGDKVTRGQGDTTRKESVLSPPLLVPPSPPPPPSRLYKTGDLARYLPDGNLEFIGRIDDQVKIRGFRIELGEIETLLHQHPNVQEAVVIAHEKTSADKLIIAYIVPHQNFDQEPQLQNEQVKQWQNLYNQTYRQPAVNSDPTFNIVGWNSSYTKQPIPAEEMAQWVSDRVAQILALQPQRVLEIGCGTGLLLFQIAPHCTQYWGTDFSPVSIQYIEQLAPALPQVKLLHRMATDFEGIAANSFDTVILNSVVQYFPNIDYLLQVLDGAINTVAPGGFIFIGDVRSLPLLSAFHAAVELHQADSAVSPQQLQQQVQLAIFQETELVIDPAFFDALKQRYERISSVQVELPRGRYHNELTQFRYNVILHIKPAPSIPLNLPPFPLKKREARGGYAIRINGGLGEANSVGNTQNVAHTPAVYTQLNWTKDHLSIAAVRQHLEQVQPDILTVTKIPNARVMAAVKTAEWLTAGTLAPKTAGGMRDALQQLELGTEPEDWWKLAAELPYTVNIRSNKDASCCFDVSFQHQDATKNIDVLPWQQELVHSGDYANKPLQAQLTRYLIPQLRTYLEQSLPEYMIPSAFILLSALPLTASGKVNRRALPAPEWGKQGRADAAPLSPIEQKLASIWTDLLGLKSVGIHDNFFQLGGHSLLATQLTSRIRDVFSVELPLRHVFESPALAQLASVIADLQSRSQQKTPDIVPLARDPHRRRRSSLNDNIGR